MIFRLGKNHGEFSKWRLACTPVSFYNSEKGPRPSDHSHRGLWLYISLYVNCYRHYVNLIELNCWLNCSVFVSLQDWCVSSFPAANTTMAGLADSFDLKDPKQAEEYLKTIGTEYGFQCHSEKRPDGCHRLGTFLEAIRKNYPAARKIFEANCEESGHDRSCFRTGIYYLLGRGGAKDYEKAMKYFDLGCTSGSGPSCHNCALMLQKGHVSSQEYSTTEDYLKRGCGDGRNDTDSCFALSTFYMQEGDHKDLAKAFHYSKLACDARHLMGCATVSKLFSSGKGVTADLEQAKKYRKIAEDIHKLTVGQGRWACNYNWIMWAEHSSNCLPTQGVSQQVRPCLHEHQNLFCYGLCAKWDLTGVRLMSPCDVMLVSLALISRWSQVRLLG